VREREGRREGEREREKERERERERETGRENFNGLRLNQVAIENYLLHPFTF
jgi:hypothetical protein